MRSAIGVLAIALALVAQSWLLPVLARPTLQFGVRIPAEHTGHPVIAAARRAYRRWIAGTGAAILVVATGLAVGLGSPFWAVAVSLGAVGAAFLAFVIGHARARHRILAVKRQEGWYAGRRQGIAVDTSLRTAPEPIPWSWGLPALLVLVGTLVAGVVRYPTMPTILPTLYEIGTGHQSHRKSVALAFTPVFTQVLFTAVIVVWTLVLFRSKPDIDATAPATTARQHRIFLVRTAKGLFGMAAFSNLGLAVIAWSAWSGGTGIAGVVLASTLIGVGIVPVVVIAIRCGHGGSRVPVAAPEDAATTLAQRDDDALWRIGLLYVNPDDPAVFVRQRFGLGWTVNYGNRVTWVIVPIAVAAFAGMAVLLS